MTKKLSLSLAALMVTVVGIGAFLLPAQAAEIAAPALYTVRTCVKG